MRILVTGGAGYIGSRTAARLRDGGHDVVALDDLSTGHAAALEGVPLIEGSILDEALVSRLIDEAAIEAVVHFAALKSVEESVADPGAYFDVNVGGTLAVLRSMARTGVRRFVYSSSCAVYGVPDQLPVAEGTPVHPLNPYGESKAIAERLLPWFEGAHGIRSAVLRYFNAAGAAEDGSAGEDWTEATNLIPIVLKVAAGRLPAIRVNGTELPTPDGSAIRDYIHVLDLAEAHDRALSVIDARGSSITVNVGTGRGTSVREVLDAARRITGRPIPAVDGPPRPGDPPAVWADTRHASEVFGWMPARGLEEILESAWRWHQTHPDGYGDATVAAGRGV